MLEGNSTRKQLKTLDSLEEELTGHSDECYALGISFIECLKAISSVVHSTFGQALQEEWQSELSTFSSCYTNLTAKNNKPISVTPKKKMFF